jgi:HlyD family secretion protein
MRILAAALASLLLAGCTDDKVSEALGTLERDRIVLKATADEIIIEQPIPEGTVVAKGTLLRPPRGYRGGQRQGERGESRPAGV